MIENCRVANITEFLNNEYKNIWEYIPETLKAYFNCSFVFKPNAEDFKSAYNLMLAQMHKCKVVGERKQEYKNDCRVIYDRLEDILKRVENALIEDFRIMPENVKNK
jgi:hypothetical protein